MTNEVQPQSIAEEFRDRLDMLEESGQVSALARRVTEMVLSDLARELKVPLTEDNAAQFVTHMAMALTRTNRGDPELTVSPLALEVIADRRREYDAVAAAMAEGSKLLQRPVPAGEVQYMTVHMCGLVDLHAESTT